MPSVGDRESESEHHDELSEEERHALVLAGKPLVFRAPTSAGDETPAARAGRTIPAAWLNGLADAARICHPPIDISNAIIDGALDLSAVEFRQKVALVNCEMSGEVRFAFSQFGRTATFQGSTFKQRADFRAVIVNGDFLLKGCVFEVQSSFMDLHVQQILNASGASFDRSNFERMKVLKSAFFRCLRVHEKLVPTRFMRYTTFRDAVIAINCDFSGARFEGDAKFRNIQIGADAFFCVATNDDDEDAITSANPRSYFGGIANFVRAQVKGMAQFSGAEFGGDALFAGVCVGGPLLLNAVLVDGQPVPVAFHGQARFLEAHFGAMVDCEGIQCDDAVELDFELAEFGAIALFRTFSEGGKPLQARLGSLRFLDAYIKGNIDFDGSEIRGPANFGRLRADGDFRANDTVFRDVLVLSRARILGTATFACDFDKAVNFWSASIGTDLLLRGAMFSEHADLRLISVKRNLLFEAAGGRQCKFRKDVNLFASRVEGSAVFGATEFDERCDLSLATIGGQVDFGGAHFPTVDLRGFTYQRLSSDWRHLLGKMEPYDRQVYINLANSLRSAGDDREADRVFLARKRRELCIAWERLRRRKDAAGLPWSETLGEAPRVVWQLVQRWLFNYGVRPLRLLVISVLFLALGCIVFSQRGAVDYKDPRLMATQPRRDPLVQPLSWRESLGYSLRLFIPIVELPAGGQWVPSPSHVIPLPGGVTYEAYASMHRLAGAILVPLGVAALSGVLVRREKS
jgi:hypothetical protein